MSICSYDLSNYWTYKVLIYSEAFFRSRFFLRAYHHHRKKKYSPLTKIESRGSTFPSPIHQVTVVEASRGVAASVKYLRYAREILKRNIIPKKRIKLRYFIYWTLFKDAVLTSCWNDKIIKIYACSLFRYNLKF